MVLSEFSFLSLWFILPHLQKNVYNKQNTPHLEAIDFPSICTSPCLLIFNVNRVGQEIDVRENIVF